MLKWNYVISLKRRDDRWEELGERMNKTCLKDEKFVRFEAFDASNFNVEVERLGMQDDFIVKMCRAKSIKVSKGVFGCYISHLKVLEEIIGNKEIEEDDYVGVYEDDFFPCDDIQKFNAEYKYLKSLQKKLNGLDIDMIYHGGRFESDFMVPINEFYLTQEFTGVDRIYKRKNLEMFYKVPPTSSLWYIDRTTSSYIIKKGSAKKIIKLLQSTFLERINNEISFRPIDLVYISRLHSQIKSFDYLPHLFYSPLDYQSDVQGQTNQQNLLDFSQI